MTETTENETPAPKPPTATWRDRTFTLKIPGAAQLMMWNRVAKQFGGFADAEEIDKDEFQKILNRLGDVVFGMFADSADVEWLEDEILAQRVVDTDLLGLFTAIGDGLQSFQSENEQSTTPNRAQRRAAQRVK